MIRAVFSLLVAFGWATLYGQSAPKLNSLSPEWVQHGTTIKITLSGENLTNATKLVFSNDSESNQSGITFQGLKAKDNKTLAAKITVAPDAPAGEREVRVITPAGVSEPVVLNLSDFREIRERGTNNSPETAQSVELPAAINGHVKAAAEVDYYRFKANQGEQLIFDVYASRMGSPLDSSLAVLKVALRELHVHSCHQYQSY